MYPQENFNQPNTPPPFAPPPSFDSDTGASVTKTRPTTTPRSQQIVELYEGGMTDIAEIVRAVGARPYAVAKALQRAGHLAGYFDLFTSTTREQNLYARFFRRKLKFNSPGAARRSVEYIDGLYGYFGRLGDRAGQHHAQVVALTGQNRARASNRHEEARIFHDWLAAH
jgi:hypothetical protein